ncbi:hypothetical protein [cf. Phormidesmis sp. LEGE 11477]|uniref:type II toxin-antitoxin system RelN family antitoxin n=1 Tax=cf. Phormidesmis sp. LEGE 11477 TaxID=1828680 RepID=UPI00187DF03E|nr:hypothetical protein [cf. Phormidesmis sp. LEGE 11477]MBE9059901.1 hypothetical protein [cf. Phormidesmis sp. LEGE 11477]
MKAIETTATINQQGQLTLDSALEIAQPQRVRVIILMSEADDEDDTPDEIVLTGIQQGMKEALSGKTLPLSEMWTGIDAE